MKTAYITPLFFFEKGGGGKKRSTKIVRELVEVQVQVRGGLQQRGHKGS